MSRVIFGQETAPKVGKRWFAAWFAVGLALAICFGTAVPVDSQQPAIREELVTLIQKHAARHTQQGEAKTDRILTLYRENELGLTPVQIEEIYETEFERLKPPGSPLDQLPPGLVAALAFVVGIAVMSFRDQLKKRFDQIWEWLYQRKGFA